MKPGITSAPETLAEFEVRFRRGHADFDKTAGLDELRAKDFDRLDRTGTVYLDFTGGNLYAERQVRKHMDYLLKDVYGNPHSQNPTSLRSGREVENTRRQILDFFHAGEDYLLVFTPNASGALKIIGESYPFDDGSHFLLPFDNHNSVNGIREYARAKGAGVTYSPLTIEDLRFDRSALSGYLHAFRDARHKLFAYPAQSNVSGVKHSLKWVKEARELGWDVLLDASAFVPTNTLDLREVTPDFVSMSFYKMFGYPTGLGGLFIRKDSFHKLAKPWFAGGTVTLASAMTENFFLAPDHARYEDGTINYLDIPALRHGFDLLSEIGMDLINFRVGELTGFLLDEMRKLTHSNGARLIRIIGPQDTTDRGGTVIFNFLEPDGTTHAYAEVERAANEFNISLRTGCFCNPGIDELSNHLEAGELDSYFKSHEQEEADVEDMMARLHTMRGAIRISLGMITNLADLHAFLQFLATFRR